jgi:arylsulfatase A-like enzyme
MLKKIPHYRRNFMKISVLGTAILILLGFYYHNFSSSPPSSQRSPNFVLVLMDDMGWKDLGVTGSLYYQTPNIDKIAKAGMIFHQAYAASPLCSPSRGALLSGKTPARTDLTNVGGLSDPYGGLHEITKPMEWPIANSQYLEAYARHVLPLEEVTIAEALAEGGYVTGFYGKWHCGRHANFQPEKQGFQYADTLSHSVERDGSPTTESSERDVKKVAAITTAAVRFIEEQQENPFFLMVSHYAMHRPLEAHPELIEKYEALPKTDQNNPVFAALLETVDESIGTIDATLERLGLLDNTVFIFASDNGGLTLGPTSNFPLLGGKSFPYEAGMVTPFFIRWPTKIKAGSQNNTRVIHMDLYPTMLEMAGLPLRPDQHVDGLNLMPLLTGSGTLKDRDLFFHFPHPTHATGPYASIIYRDWKLIRWYNDTSGAYSLFNLAEDPGELVDLADRLPQRVKRLNERLVQWQRETNAQMPRPNPNFDPSLPPVRDKAFTRRLAMKERKEFEQRLKEYEKKD